MHENYGILWFRRDLRIYDHRPLKELIKTGLKLLPIFIYDTEILERFSDKNDRRISFIANALSDIQKEFKKNNSEILIIKGKSREVIPQLNKILGGVKIFAGEDHEPGPRDRDNEIAQEVKKNNGELILIWDHLLQPPHKNIKNDQTAFKVFSPFYKTWLKNLSDEDIMEAKVDLQKANFANINELKIKLQNFNIISPNSSREIVEAIGYNYIEEKLWKTNEAEKRLYVFTDNYLNKYKKIRDFLGEEGSTSAISPYLRFGLLSIRHVYKAAISSHEDNSRWINELCWREFYAMIMYYFPNTVREEFIGNYRGKEWNNNQKWHEKFVNAETGFPIVDAAVRQLLNDGWMHNRGRLVTASFYTKDLLLDWRKGEEFFAQYLMDYEMSSNVGNWQWCASTGTDAQPYFRVFNPYTQSEKFDPEGKYIKKYLPELSNIPLKYLHTPHKFCENINYPFPIVNHSEMREKAIEFYKIK